MSSASSFQLQLLAYVVALVTVTTTTMAQKWDPANPSTVFMWGPYTPFNDDDAIAPSINVDAMPDLVASAAIFGVNVLSIGASNGQFDTMTVAERKQLCDGWVAAAAPHDMYVIYHVGATRIEDAIELAAYASGDCGADAISALPPYYQQASKLAPFTELFAWFAPIVDAAAPLPFWYYHFPGRSLYDISIAALLGAALGAGGGLPGIAGVKFVSDDNRDWFDATNAYGDQVFIVNQLAPELARMSMDKGAGVGLSDYLIPVYKCMRASYDAGDMDRAYEYQQFRYDFNAALGSSVERRCLYRQFANVQMGPPRPPLIGVSDAECDTYLAAVAAGGWFDQLSNMTGDATCTIT